jgi:protein TonB
MSLFSTRVSDSKPWFLSLIDAVREWRHPVAPVQISATPVAVPELWTRHKAAVPRTLSLLMHVTLITLAFIPWVTAPKPLPLGVIDVALLAPNRLTFPVDQKPAGGGGGGRHALTPASLGKPPKAAETQMVPPDPEPPKNLDPSLIMESTIVAPPLSLPKLNLVSIGDPDGIAGPPSPGPGKGYGIGNGDGHGVGIGDGPGVGDGKNGGCCGGAFNVGGGLISPVLISQVPPEYSEEARKARYQGTVVLNTIVMPDGSVKVVQVKHSLGLGLDEKAIAAVLQWKFRPGRMNGIAVPVTLWVEVNFNLR